MRMLLVIGLVLLVLGIASMSLPKGKVHPVISAVLIGGGIALALAGRRSPR